MAPEEREQKINNTATGDLAMQLCIASPVSSFLRPNSVLLVLRKLGSMICGEVFSLDLGDE